MNLPEAILLGAALAMDALAVSLALGAAQRRAFTVRRIAATAFFFGWFQFMMPLVGWFGGSRVLFLSGPAGRAAAAILLAGLGLKMIFDAVWGKREAAPAFGWRTLTLLALATSIDALIVGVGWACLGRRGVWPEAAVIGVVTAAISAGGGLAGRVTGRLTGHWGGAAGVLVLIGSGVGTWFRG